MTIPSTPELYIHIGYPKTGTTFLQKEVLPKLSRVHYVERRLIREELARLMHQNEFSFDYGLTKSSLERHFLPGKNIISKESLVGNFFFHKSVNNKLIADRLAKLFPKAKVILTIRNQYGLIESLYKQYILIGGTKKLRDFVNFRDGRFENSYCDWDFTIHPEMLNYLSLADYYAERLGRDNICILPFERLKKSQEEFLGGLFSWMGIEEHAMFESKVYNAGLGRRQITIARFLNRFLKSTLNEAAMIPDIKLPLAGKIDVGKLRRILQSPLSRKMLGQEPITDEELKAEIKKVHASANKTLNQKYQLKLEELTPNDYF